MELRTALKMKSILRKYKAAISIFLSIIESVLLGIYLSLIANKLELGNSFLESINQIKNTYLYIIFIILCLFAQIYIEQQIKQYDKKEKEELVNSMLKVACDSFVYPHNNYNIRAIITLCDYKRNKRKTIYSYNILASPERFAEYDLFFGVTGEAIKNKVPVAQSLREDHMDEYDEQTRMYVESRLKCVLAAPIFSNRNKEKVIGVLAFDSINDIEKMKFSTDKSKEIAQSWADIFTNIIES